MRLKLVLTGLAVLAATVLPTVASAHPEAGRGTFLSLPPDLTTGYLQGHYPHRDPQHPNANYRTASSAPRTSTGWTGSTARPMSSPRVSSATSR